MYQGSFPFNRLTFIALLLTMYCGELAAQPIIDIRNSAGDDNARFEYVNPGSGSVFRTRSTTSTFLPDGAPQFVSIDYSGSIGGFPDVPSGASLLLDRVLPQGAVAISGNTATLNTNGGTLNLWSDRGRTQLLLSASLGQGALVRTNVSPNIVRFDSAQAIVTGGSLASYFPCKLNLSLTLDNFSTCIPTSKRCFVQPLCWTGNCANPTPTPVPAPEIPEKFTAQLSSARLTGIVQDACGICGGSGQTCLDCAGIIGGNRTFDRCGVCGGNNSCIDCAGIPFGGRVPDACGVCGGNGSTCINCNDVDIKDKIRALDTGIDALKKYAQSLAKILRNARGQLNAQDQKLLGLVEEFFNEAWRDINLRIPSVILVCPTGSVCAEVSHAAVIQDYQRISSSMENLIAQLSNRTQSALRDAVAQGEIDSNTAAQRTKRAKSLKNSASRQNLENQAAANDIPPSTRSCS